MDYDKSYFIWYICRILGELDKRKINYNKSLRNELWDFCPFNFYTKNNYPEHNDRYLKQCYYNLQEKADRGIIKSEEWEEIYRNVKVPWA